jgi:hypothetical protein
MSAHTYRRPLPDIYKGYMGVKFAALFRALLWRNRQAIRYPDSSYKCMMAIYIRVTNLKQATVDNLVYTKNLLPIALYYNNNRRNFSALLRYTSSTEHPYSRERGTLGGDVRRVALYLPSR